MRGRAPWLVAALATGLIAGDAAGAASDAPHYQVKAALDTAHGAVAVEVEISEPASAAGDGAIFLLGRGYKVSAIGSSPNATATVQDTNDPFPVQKLTLRANPGASGRVVLKVSYAGPVPTGDTNAVSPQRVELSADSLWYPLSANFNTRFTLDATLTGLSKDFAVASPDEVRIAKDHIELNRPVPSQDIAFTASPAFKTVSAGPLQFFARDLNTDQARNYQLYGAKALAYYRPWFGPIPHRKAVVAIVERKSGVGYSRPGYLVVADVGTLAPDNLWGRVGYVAHELSHEWWSNADFTGEDYWLVESTAEYVALRFMETQLGPKPVADILEKKMVRAARGGPILGHGRPSNDAVYAKGPILLVELEKSIGRPKLDRILGALARRETLTTKDFLAELTQVAGADAARAFEVELRR